MGHFLKASVEEQQVQSMPSEDPLPSVGNVNSRLGTAIIWKKSVPCWVVVHPNKQVMNRDVGEKSCTVIFRELL